MKESGTLSGALAGVLLDFLDAEGLPAADCRARLAAWDRQGRVARREWLACLRLIRQADSRPALGFRIARHIRPEHAGTLGYLLLSCENFGELLARLQGFHNLMWQGYPFVLTHEANTVTLTWKQPPLTVEPELAPLQPLGYEIGLAAMVHILRQLCGETFNPCAAVVFGPAPADTREHEAFVKCPVSFAPDATALSYPRALLTQPIHAEKARLKQLVERVANAELQSLPADDAFLQEFRQQLLGAIRQGTPTVDVVSRAMAISGPTLKRKLNARGAAFQQLLDSTRLELARSYLENSSLSLAEIASLLAFSEQSAFCRSFKRWTGKTPQEWR